MAIDTQVHVEVVIPNEDGLAVDEFTTSFNYQTTGVDSAGMTALVQAFFNNAGTGQAGTIAGRMSASASRALPVQVRYYDVTGHLDGSPHGAPFEVDTFTLAAEAGGTHSDLPNQICVVLSYWAALDTEGSTRPDKRGRMFIGPLTSEVQTTTTAGNPRVAALIRTDFTAAFRNLAAAASALTNPKPLAVWTRRFAGFQPVLGVWMEDRLDTQRRRALAATTRTTITF